MYYIAVVSFEGQEGVGGTINGKACLNLCNGEVSLKATGSFYFYSAHPEIFPAVLKHRQGLL